MKSQTLESLSDSQQNGDSHKTNSKKLRIVTTCQLHKETYSFSSVKSLCEEPEHAYISW